MCITAFWANAASIAGGGVLAASIDPVSRARQHPGPASLTAALCVLLLATLSSGCGTSEAVRSVSYPSSFQYLTEDEVRGAMGGLAVQIVALDALMVSAEGPRGEDQGRVVEILEEMQTLVRQLTQREQSNHPQISRTAPLLERKIDRALFGARSNPPNYYFAGTVSGVCSYCHAPRHRADVPGAWPVAQREWATRQPPRFPRPSK